MAMTKKERAEMDAAIDRAIMLGALRWTSPVEPDVPIPTGYNQRSSGFGFNAHTGTVSAQWSGSVTHGEGTYRQYSGTQGGKRLYSARVLALKAMRHQMELQFAQKLMAVDKEIAEEEAKP